MKTKLHNRYLNSRGLNKEVHHLLGIFQINEIVDFHSPNIPEYRGRLYLFSLSFKSKTLGVRHWFWSDPGLMSSPSLRHLMTFNVVLTVNTSRSASVCCHTPKRALPYCVFPLGYRREEEGMFRNRAGGTPTTSGWEGVSTCCLHIPAVGRGSERLKLARSSTPHS